MKGSQLQGGTGLGSWTGPRQEELGGQGQASSAKLPDCWVSQLGSASLHGPAASVLRTPHLLGPGGLSVFGCDALLWLRGNLSWEMGGTRLREALQGVSAA